MSGEPDSGTCAGGSARRLKLEHPPSIMRLCRSGGIINNNNNNEDGDCDLDKVSVSNSNYDSNDATAILRCDRCDAFETISRALLIVHMAQCAGASAATTVKRRHSEALTENGGVESDAQTTSSTTTSAATVGPTDASSADNKQQLQQQHHRKLFECDVCNMKFSNGANMRRHKMRHTGVKPYECRVCQKRFFRKDHLAEHFTTHTKTLPYHCPICNRGFQRQIAMRAHFQNEHVGQHELVKTCPLCSYRAGTMKSLRVHFFNRHGIDLDNPGANAPSSLLMALDPQNASNFLQSSIAAAMAAAAASGGNNNNNNNNGGSPASGHNQLQQSFSDSGDSLRSADNGTPPMHFLTPHVEISMADGDSFKVGGSEHDANSMERAYSSASATTPTTSAKIEPLCGSSHAPPNVSSALEIKVCEVGLTGSGGGGLTPGGRYKNNAVSPQSIDSNSNVPSSSQTVLSAVLQQQHNGTARPVCLAADGQITPSISLIPIKQEPASEDYNDHTKLVSSRPIDATISALSSLNASTLSSSNNNNNNNTTSNVSNSIAAAAENSTPTSSLTSLIKVSPLKSLLREDLKRRISARSSNRSTRSSSNNCNTNNNNINNNNNHSSSTTSHHHLASNSNNNNSSSHSVTTMMTSSADVSTAMAAAMATATTTTSNGAITSTGADTELQMSSAARRRMLQCLFCGIEFPDQTLYFLHKGCHSESNPWKCNICGEQLGNVYEFNSHLLSKSHQ